ncbi:MAG TPA: type 1 glutamine amidotransferase [Burkholderiaceae bacterium]|nr:type 1 glutamine amidotransferase [Burkholderiaceae bacterium]
MKPVLVLQHLSADGPAYLRTWLEREGCACDVFDAERGQAYPDRIAGYGALAVLGGEMSANDALPSLRQAERLILESLDRDLPVIGHCLGGQLMARALGARVHASPAPEIGWQPIRMAHSASARAWFGDAQEHVVYQWHHEAFELPPGAEPLAGSPSCVHQAFALGERQLAIQFHVELDAAKLAVWASSRDPAFLRQQREHPFTVQSGAAMLEQAREALPAQQQLADRIYRRWLHGSD